MQGDSGNYVADSRIAEETDLALDDVRNWFLTLQDKELVSIVRGETGLRRSSRRRGVLTLKQSLPFTLKRIEDEQRQQRHELEMIRFIISHLINQYEVMHLEQLAGDAPFPFEKRISFDQELRHLRDIGFVENCPGVSPSIAQLPHRGDDLRRFFRLTERGRQYLGFKGRGGFRRRGGSGGLSDDSGLHERRPGKSWGQGMTHPWAGAILTRSRSPACWRASSS